MAPSSTLVIEAPTVRFRAIYPGVMIGDYEVINAVGEGGVGVVYAAVHPRIGKRVAIKVLRETLWPKPELVARFALEARSVNRINHPNIIDIFAYGQLSDGRPYMVMEWLAGESLEQRLRKCRTLSRTDAMPLLHQIAEALDATHEGRVVHRDLKPENIYIVAGLRGLEQIKILDFGLAKFTDEASCGTTQTGTVLGTPYYMSPEQCSGRSVDARTDVYAFGVLTYRALTGQYPVTGESASALLSRQLYAPPVPPSHWGMSSRLDPVFAKVLAKNPDDRYTTLTEFTNELAAVWDPDCDDRNPAQAAPQPTQFPSAAALLAEEDLPNSVRDDSLMRKVYRCAEGTGGQDVVHAREAHKPNSSVKDWSCIGHSQAVTSIEFAPSGRLLASGSADHTVHVWDRRGGQIAKVDCHEAPITKILFDRKSSLLASADVHGIVHLLDLETQTTHAQFDQGSAVTGMVFVNEGSELATASVNGSVTIWSLSGQKLRRVRVHKGPVRNLEYLARKDMLISAGEDAAIRLWPRLDGKSRSLRGHSGPVRDSSVSPTSPMIASASQDGTVREWDLCNRACKSYEGPGGSLELVEYSPNGQSMAAAGTRSKVVLWNRASQERMILQGHKGHIQRIAFSPDSTRLATASDDGTVRLWDVRSGGCIQIVPHPSGVQSIAFSTRGTCLASGDLDGNIVLTRASRRTNATVPNKRTAPSTARSPRNFFRNTSKTIFYVPAAGASILLLLLYGLM